MSDIEPLVGKSMKMAVHWGWDIAFVFDKYLSLTQTHSPLRTDWSYYTWSLRNPYYQSSFCCPPGLKIKIGCPTLPKSKKPKRPDQIH